MTTVGAKASSGTWQQIVGSPPSRPRATAVVKAVWFRSRYVVNRETAPQISPDSPSDSSST